MKTMIYNTVRSSRSSRYFCCCCKVKEAYCMTTSRNGLKVAKAGHKSECLMGMMADSYDSERLRGGGADRCDC